MNGDDPEKMQTGRKKNDGEKKDACIVQANINLALSMSKARTIINTLIKFLYEQINLQ